MPIAFPFEPARCLTRPAFCTALVVGLLLGGCDLPTESPSFQVETEVRAPVLTETTFQVLGTSGPKRQVLIDTSRNAWDTLFTADPADNTVRLVQELDALNVGELDEVIPSLSFGNASFSFSAEDFASAGKRAGSAQDLRAATASAGAVTVSSEGTISFDASNVSFESDQDFLDLEAGRLRIEDLSNSFNIDIKVLELTLLDVREPGGEALTITYEGSTVDEEAHTYPKLEANSTRELTTVDLSGMRVKPTGENIDYRIEVTVDQVPTSDGELSGSLGADRLSLDRLEAVVNPIWTNLTDDTDGDDRLELGRDSEAQITEIPGLKQFDDLLKSLHVDGAALEIRLRTDLPVGTDVFLAMQGIGGSDEIFLRGRNDLAVSSTRAGELDLYDAGGAIEADRLIRLPVPKSASPTTVTDRTVDLHVGAQNSNVDAFLSTLPEELRLVGQALFNPGGPQRMALEPPIELKTDVEAQIPVRASGDLLTLKDRREVDFSDLDALSDTSGTRIESAKLRFLYTNGLPVGGRVTAEVLDANKEPIGVDLGTGEDPLLIEAAGTENGLAVQPVEGSSSVELSAEEVDRLHRGRYLDIELSVRADGDTPVRLQADDRIEIAVRGSFELKVKTQ